MSEYLIFNTPQELNGIRKQAMIISYMKSTSTKLEKNIIERTQWIKYLNIPANDYIKLN